MPEVVLLCSVHKENGRCNSSELVRILELIEPDVLFEEIPYFEFLEKNNLGNGRILEVRAISKYLERHKVLQIPVDTLDGSSFEQIKFDQVIDRVSHTSPEFRSLWDHKTYLEYTRGFEYLNSRSNDSMLRRSDSIVTKALEELNDERLSMAYDEWKTYNSKREDAMIGNVYEFCRLTNFKKGVFLFGSGHRQSLISKIKMVKKTEKGRVNWKLDCGVSNWE